MNLKTMGKFLKNAIGLPVNLIPYEYQNRKDIGIFLVFISGNEKTQMKKVELLLKFCECLREVKQNGNNLQRQSK